MKYKLVPMRNKKPKNQFRIEVEYMHGDADHETTETIICKTKEVFLERYKILKDRLDYRRQYHNAAINSNDDWCREHERWLCAPYDVTSNFNYRATIDGLFDL